MLNPEDYEMDNTPDQEYNRLADFTGRELLQASIYEKCYHEELKKVIETGKTEDLALEQVFLRQMVTRLAECESGFAESGEFPRSCLFAKE